MRRMRLGILVLLLVAACADGEMTPGPNDGSDLKCEVKGTIEIDDRGIDPEVTQARTGDAITVINRGTTDHGLTSDSIDTGTMRPDESATVCFTETGTIEVFDRSDFSHKARIEVTEAESP